MSFGFGIGDIVLCTKLAYGLYSTLTDGRANAPKDLKELGNAIFGLYCALDHLQKEYPAILDRTAGSAKNAALLKQQLGSMIAACRGTLEELDTTTAKYRDAADDVQSVAVPSQGPVISLPHRHRFKAQAKVQLRRITWDLRGDSLSKYRPKLQSHTDALNLLLNSLIWSTTARIEESTAEHAQRMNQLVREASKFSTNFAQFMQQIQAIRPPALPLPGPANHFVNFVQIDQPREIDPSSLVPRDDSPIIGGGDNISAHFARIKPPPAAPASLKRITQPSQWPPGLHVRLPQNIHVLNQSRQVVGEKEFKARQKALGADPAIPLTKGPTTQYNSVRKVQDLSRVLDGIFNTLNTSPTARMTTNEQLWNDIVDWVDKLDTLSDILSSRSTLDKDERNRTISETVKLLATLNQLNEKAKHENKGMFFEASSMKIDCVFIKLKRLSTHCAKEIEEFEDEREDWKAR